nr:lasso peptide biosynthesis B2 protein [Adonisia turfae]
MLLQTFLLLPSVALSLKFWGLKFTQAILVKLFPIPASPPPDHSHRLITTTRMVQLAVKYCQPWANCLKKSLVLWSLLRAQGIDGQLRIGVRQDAQKFEAHAWVEWQDFILGDRQDVRERFAMFDRPIDISSL